MESLDVSFYGFNNEKLEVVLLVESLLSSVGKVLGSDEVIIMGSFDGKVLSTILGNLDGITLGIYVGTDQGSLDGSIDGPNDGKFEGFFLGDSLVSTVGKVLGSYYGIKLVLSYCKVLGTILVNVDLISLVIDVGTDVGCLYGSFDGYNY